MNLSLILLEVLLMVIHYTVELMLKRTYKILNAYSEFTLTWKFYSKFIEDILFVHLG